MPTPADRLTIGVCTYNRGPQLLDTLRSILAMRSPIDPATNQGRIAEVLVIDNNCTDGTAELVDSLIASRSASSNASSPAFIPLRRVVEQRQGLAQARRRVFAEATTDLIAFLDDDVIADPAWGESILTRLDAAPRAGVVGSRVRLSFQSGPTPLAQRYRSFLAEQEMGTRPLNVTDATKALVGAAMALRRKAVEDSGWLGRQLMPDRQGLALSSGGDNELCIRIRRSGWETWYEPGAVVDHLIPAARQTREYLARLAAGIGLSIPHIKLLANPDATAYWATCQLRAAQTRYVRTLLLEWRSQLRPIRLAEHEGRVEGWRSVIETLSATPPVAGSIPAPAEPTKAPASSPN